MAFELWTFVRWNSHARRAIDDRLGTTLDAYLQCIIDDIFSSSSMLGCRTTKKKNGYYNSTSLLREEQGSSESIHYLRIDSTLAQCSMRLQTIRTEPDFRLGVVLMIANALMAHPGDAYMKRGSRFELNYP